MTTPKPDCSSWLRIVAATVAALLAAAALSGCAPEKPDAASSITVEVDGTAKKATLSAGELTEVSLAGLQEVTAAGAIVGVPTEIELAFDMPEAGVTLSRVYVDPVPEDAAASFMFFNENLGAWEAVPSELSEDRRTLTATVHHLSVWNDVIAGTQQAVMSVVAGAKAAGQKVAEANAAIGKALDETNKTIGKAFADGADALYFGVGKIFDTRVDDPVCDGPATPTWVQSTVMIDYNANNPILFCVGRDAKAPDLLVVKARVNRGFGYTVTTAATPRWSYNSTAEQNVVDAALAAVGDLDGTIARSVADLTAGGTLVGAGQEISYGFTAASVNSAPVGEPLVILHPPTVRQFLATAIAGALVKWGTSAVEGHLAAVIAVGSCTNDIKDTTDVLAGAKAALTCLGAVDEKVAQKLALAFLSTGKTPKEAGAAAGSLVAKASLALAIVAPATSALNFVAESATPDSARSVTVFTATPAAGGGLEDLSSWVIGYGAVGPLTVGTSLDQIHGALSEAAGEDVEPGSFDDFGGQCQQGNLTATGTTAYIGYLSASAGSTGPVDRFFIHGPQTDEQDFTIDQLPRTAGGVGVGSSEADVKAEFGTGMQEEPNRYVEGGKELFTLGPNNTAIGFITDGTGTVTSIVTGTLPQVYWPEGCA
ncbi:hypothetical protein ACDF64_03165 [Agromyces sp. MMS24-JH15]|uniref:hypothetical protein n=1 Tax=Agromyces sp. MMS24-JH15 TaxID=3243765 RepID=UPI003749F9C3